MERKPHETHPSDQHKSRSYSSEPKLMPTMPYLAGIVDDEERRIGSTTGGSGASVTDINDAQRSSSLRPMDQPTPKIATAIGTMTVAPTLNKTDQIQINPPITRKHLMTMDGNADPPCLEACHDLILDGKAKIDLVTLRPSGLRAEEDESYWIMLSNELRNPKDGDKDIVLLPALIREIISMLVYLYPESKSIKTQLITELDGDFFVQALYHGQTDALNAIETLCSALKDNCAPKRDPLIEHILRQARKGNWVGMFRLCLDLMELMKLDLINYSLSVRRKSFFQQQINKEIEYYEKLFDPRISEMTATLEFIKCVNTYPGNMVPEKVMGVFVDLITSSQGSINIPETFHLDSKRIKNLQDSFQDITILGSLLILTERWVGAHSKQTDLLQEVKLRIARSMAYPDTKIVDIANQILLVACRAKRSLIKGEERELLIATIDKILCPSSKVYKLLQEKINKLIVHHLRGQKLEEIKVRKLGLDPIKMEFQMLIEQAKSLWTVHWLVHGQRYEKLLLGSLPM